MRSILDRRFMLELVRGAMEANATPRFDALMASAPRPKPNRVRRREAKAARP
jgi:hypothetical protein